MEGSSTPVCDGCGDYLHPKDYCFYCEANVKCDYHASRTMPDGETLCFECKANEGDAPGEGNSGQWK